MNSLKVVCCHWTTPTPLSSYLTFHSPSSIYSKPNMKLLSVSFTYNKIERHPSCCCSAQRLRKALLRYTLSLSLSHTHTHTKYLPLSLNTSLSLSFSVSFFLSSTASLSLSLSLASSLFLSLSLFLCQVSVQRKTTTIIHVSFLSQKCSFTMVLFLI